MTPAADSLASPTADPRWIAVLTRDPRAEGSLYYGVASTGIYCRPTCPARRPRPDRVRFFGTPQEAELAEFRACRRCRPERPPAGAELPRLVGAVCRAFDEQDPPPSVAALARAVGWSEERLRRAFREVTGLTPRAYLRGRRAERLRGELATSDTVTAALYRAGYASAGQLAAEAQDLLGMTPRAFRGGGRGAQIRFALAETRLGALLVAATDRGVCWLALGDEPDPLLRELQERFREAELIGADPEFEGWVAAASALVEDSRRQPGFPLELRGTAFQRRVWQALQATQPGERLSYGELAARLGLPRGARAVAAACAQNVLAVAVPCHRVVRQDGGLAGYRWGVERKRELLAREAEGG